MSLETVAHRYAQAIFDLGKEEANLGTLARELTSFAELYESSAELRSVLESPLVEDAARQGILRELGSKLTLSTTAQNTLLVLAKNRRLNALPDIARELVRLVDADGRVLRAEVQSARPLSPTILDRIKGEIEKATGQKVVLSHREDPSLVAGIVTRIGDRVVDGSVRARLSSFRDSLTST